MPAMHLDLWFHTIDSRAEQIKKYDVAGSGRKNSEPKREIPYECVGCDPGAINPMYETKKWKAEVKGLFIVFLSIPSQLFNNSAV